jgi:hypothetical protein
LSFGWPYYTTWPYYSMGYYPPYYSAGYAPDYGSPVDDPAETPPTADTRGAYESDRPVDTSPESGRLRIEVRPEDASVYVDDQFRGTGREARLLTLPRGHHVVELVRPGFATERREVEVVAGETRDVLVELQRP